MKVLLVQPSSRVTNFIAYRGITHPPLALLFLAGVLRENGIEVKIVDNNIFENWRKALHDFSPDIVGLSCLTGPAIKDAIDVSKEAKRLNKDIKIVWGGIHASLLPAQTLKEEFIDYVVIGEGELTFLELVQTLGNKGDVSKVMGIAYKKPDGSVVITEKRPFLNMDHLPDLPYDLVNARRYLKYETCIQTSRGCPYSCTFCYQHAIHGCKWRGMNATKVLRQIEKISEIEPVKKIKFVDDNFTVHKKRLFEIIDGLDKDIDLYFEVRVNHIDSELLQKLKKFHDVQLAIGVESGSQAMLDRLKKGIKIEQIRKAFSLCNEYKIRTSALGMIGLPGEKKGDVENTISFMKSLKPLNYSISVFIPFPGTPIFDEVVSQGRINPPSRLIDWAFYEQNRDKINVSDVDSDYLDRMSMRMINKSVVNYLLGGRTREIHDKVFTTWDDSLLYLKHRVLKL